MRPDAGALSLLAGAMGVTGVQVTAAPPARAADRWRGPLGAADALALPEGAPHRFARLQLLRHVLDRRADGRWSLRVDAAQAGALVGPRGLPPVSGSGAADGEAAAPARRAPWLRWSASARAVQAATGATGAMGASGASHAPGAHGLPDASATDALRADVATRADDRADLARLLASWPHPRVLRRLFLWCDGRRVDAALAARWPGAARDPSLDPSPAMPWGPLPLPADATGALRQALGLYARLLAGRDPARRRLRVEILTDLLLREDLPPPTGAGDDPGEVEGPRPPGGAPADAPLTEPMAADPSEAPMSDGVLGPTGEVTAPEAGADDDSALVPQAGAPVVRLAGADDAADETVRHDEWDCRQQTYLRRWTTVHERRLRGDDLAWRDDLRARFPLLTQQIRRRFTRLAADAWRRERRLADGELVDLEAAIDAAVARRAAAGAVDERLYASRVRRDRDVSVALLIDMSGSTSFQIPARPDPAAAAAAQAAVDDDAPFFWQVDHRLSALERGPRRRVIDVVKDAAGLLCEALHALGDRHAIWAFSGEGRDRVDFARVKDFDQPWGPTAAAALAAVEPQGSTRTGAAVRHALRRLRREPARRRVLIVLSDGYPQDRDYGPDPDDPEYGLQDTAHALREAERAGVATFNLSVDAGAHDYLRRMCPRNRYWVVDEVDELPARMLDLYRLMAV